MEQDKTLDNLVRKAERLRLINKYGALTVQLPITIFTHTPSGLENYIHSKTAALILVGLGAVTAATAKLKLHREKEKSPVYTGIYGIVRHPTYLGFRLASLGLVAYNPSIENLIAGGALLLTSELTARAEEKMLDHIHPLEYSQYKEKVPRWLPYSNYAKAFIINLKNRAFNSFRRTNPS